MAKKKRLKRLAPGSNRALNRVPKNTKKRKNRKKERNRLLRSQAAKEKGRIPTRRRAKTHRIPSPLHLKARKTKRPKGVQKRIKTLAKAKRNRKAKASRAVRMERRLRKQKRKCKIKNKATKHLETKPRGK